jgi:hypothetical protein
MAAPATSQVHELLAAGDDRTPGQGEVRIPACDEVAVSDLKAVASGIATMA